MAKEYNKFFAYSAKRLC